jgi:hypothetical protein
MTVIFDNGVVLHKDFGVDDAVSAHLCSGIDQRMVHDDGFIGNLGMGGDISQRGLDHRKLRSQFQQDVKKRHATDRGFDLPQSDQHIGIRLDQYGKIVIASHNRIPQNRLPLFFGQINNTGDLIFTFPLDDIDTGFAMATAADKKNRGVLRTCPMIMAIVFCNGS